jgi:hypothetical protein
MLSHIFQLGVGINRAISFATVHEETFPLPHYFVIYTLNSIKFVFQDYFFHLCCILNFSWCAWPTDVIVIMDTLSTIFELYAPFCDLRHTRYSVSIHVYLLAVDFHRETHREHINRIILQTLSLDQFPNVLAMAHQLIPWTASDKLCLAPAVAVALDP